MPASAEDVDAFVNVTGGSKESAQRYLKAAGGDVQQAILMFFDAAEGAADDGGAPVTAGAATPAPSDTGTASIDAILRQLDDTTGGKGAGKGGKGDTGRGDGAGKGKGKGSGVDERSSQKVGLIFFADGFVVDEDMEDLDEEEEEKEEAPKPFVRRSGMMTLDSLPRESRGGPKLPKKIPKLGPLRAYNTPENKKFIEEVQAGFVPKEMMKVDDKGKPIHFTFAISDERPKTHAELSKVLEQMRKMKEAQEAEAKKNAPPPSTVFTGAGHTCSSSSAATPTAAVGAGKGSCDPELLKIINTAAAPVVDESKPATTLQLRLSTGARVKARLNLDHTVADLWCLVSKEMGAAVFAANAGHELCAGFPPKPLKDPAVTISAADLANASVTHRCH